LGIYVGNGKEPFIVMELMNAGDLKKLLQSNSDFTDLDLLAMFLFVLRVFKVILGLQMLLLD
jgi:serine/threonine protein kinase